MSKKIKDDIKLHDDDLEIIDLDELDTPSPDAESDPENLNDLKERRSSRKRRYRSGRRKARLLRNIVLSAALLLIAGICTFFIFKVRKNPVIEEDISELMEDLSVSINEETPGDGLSEGEDTDEGSGVFAHIKRAMQITEDAYRKRPPMIELTDENRADFVKIQSTLIEPESGQICVSTQSEGIPKSDDKYYYLFDLNTYENEIGEEDEYIAKVYKDSESQLRCSIRSDSSTLRLYKKFAVAVKEDGKYSVISTPSYITNPEVIAKHSGTYMNPDSKKGILVDYGKLNSGQLEDLGIKQAAINLQMGTIIGPTTNPAQPTINYTYNGRTYSFNGAAIAGFDNAVRDLNNKGISVTAILLNTYAPSYTSLIHPNARSIGACKYYMFNGADQAGVETLAAVGSFLADHYSGSAHGRISNYIIANEINARKEWNYMDYTDVDTYTKAYADAFRVLYTAIKSTSGSVRVYISLDQQWNRNIKNNPDYDGRDVLDSFNSYISKHGNIDWALAFHPYNVPLTTCKTWASSKYVSHNADSSMITMQNIEVLINYMNQASYLEADGDVRSILLSELGYTSIGSGSESLQAAAIAYAYYKTEHYKDIDGLLLNRQTDSSVEIAQGLATGITSQSGGKKLSYNIYKCMGTDREEEDTAAIKSVIGISKWSDIMY